MAPLVAVAVARRVPAFDAPGHETRLARRLRKLLPAPRARRRHVVSVSVRDGDVFTFLEFLCSARGRAEAPHQWRQLVAWLDAMAHGATPVARPPLWHDGHDEWETLAGAETWDVAVPSARAPTALALIAFRPNPLLPLSLASARRAVTFVHGVVALVTANAYISTLGGGHFLCLHLAQAKLMARLQIAIADALHDPVLKSKCRVNLAYNAMREGRFRRAKRLLHAEETVAVELENDELVKICEAAQVYLAKTIRLHREFLRQRADLTVKERAVVDNFYRQRILRKAH